MLPEAAVGPVSLVGLVEGVVEGCHDKEQVGQACRDLVQQERLRREVIAARERVTARGGGF